MHNGAPLEQALCVACAIHTGEVVDRNGFHTAACPSSFRARKDDCHDKIRDVLGDAVERVGGIGKKEPATKGVLLNQIDSSIISYGWSFLSRTPRRLDWYQTRSLP